METNVNYTIVGAFVILLCTAITLGIIWLSSGFSTERYTTYAIYMQESVSGLNIDSLVEFNGVDVGTVSSIELDPNNPRLVELLIKIKSSTPITQGTVATLHTRGLTGITYIALKDKSEDLRPLELRKDQPYPVIQTSPSLSLRLEAALGELSADFKKISSSFETLFDKDNQQNIKETLVNLQRVTQSLAVNSAKLSAIMQNTERASAQLPSLIQSSTSTMRMLESQTLPAAYRLLNNLDDVARTLSEVSVELKQNPAILIRGVDHRPLGPGESR